MFTRCLALWAALGLAVAPLLGTPQIVDTFADGDSRSEDLAAQSLRVFNGRTANPRTDAFGSAMLALVSSSSEAAWMFFTAAGAPITLGAGEKVAFRFTFSAASAPNGNVRFGLLNSLGPRNMTNLTGGHNTASFAGDTGYGAEWVTNATDGTRPFSIGQRNLTPSGANNRFNRFADFPLLPVDDGSATARQALQANTDYVLAMTVERLAGGGGVRVTAEASGGTPPADYRVPATDATDFDVAFDYFTFRIGGSSFASALTIKRLEMEYSPAPPVITQEPQPSELTVAAGGLLSLSVIATGAARSYQWRRDTVPLDGQTGPNLVLTGLTLGQGGAYEVVVSNAGGSVTSAAVQLTVSSGAVDDPPVVVTPPASASVVRGQPVTFTVVATGNGLGYQWTKAGNPIAGATAAAYTIDAVAPAAAAAYACRVSNSGGTVTAGLRAEIAFDAASSQSATAANTLTWTHALGAVASRCRVVGVAVEDGATADATVSGGTVTLTVTVGGGAPASFVWRKDGTVLPGEDGPTLVLANVGDAAARTYAVEVANAAGSAASEPIVLTVGAPPSQSDGVLYVAPGGLADPPGTFDQPTTLDRAIERVPNGGTILVRGGTYTYATQVTIARSNNGAASLPKRVFAYTNPAGETEAAAAFTPADAPCWRRRTSAA